MDSLKKLTLQLTAPGGVAPVGLWVVGIIMATMIIGCGPPKTTQELVAEWEALTRRWATKMELPIGGVSCSSSRHCTLRTGSELLKLDCHTDGNCIVEERLR